VVTLWAPAFAGDHKGALAPRVMWGACGRGRPQGGSLPRHPGLDPGSMLRPLLWIPDQVRDDEAVGSEVSLRSIADVPYQRRPLTFVRQW